MAKDLSHDRSEQEIQPPVDPADYPSTHGANQTKPDHPHANAGDATKAVEEDATPWPATGSGSPERPARSHWPAIEGFEILDELGHGGMGVVYKAQQLKLNRPVALKMVLAGPYASPAAISRFMGEAWSAARLQHPNIVQVYDLGEWNGQPYFAMEYVDGGHLARRAARKPFGFREAAEIIEALARAVHYAHQCGVVHRDLKPGNVLLTRDGVPKIADFGLAKRLNAEEGPTHAVTATGAIMGTPGYLSPEQAAGKTKEVGPPADVYALGVMLYEFITGRRPFDGESELNILQRVISEDPAAPSRLRSSVPRDVETICLKCLEKDPRRRYTAAVDLADDLRRYLNGEPILARRIPMVEAIGRSVKRRPLAAVLTGLLLVALGLAGMRTWNYFAYERPTVQYFQNCVFRWDIAEGVGPISNEEARHRNHSIRLTRLGFKGPVEKLEVVNGRGAPHTVMQVTPSIGRDEVVGTKLSSVIEYVRDADGQVNKIIALDRAGRVVWKFNFANPSYGHFYDEHDNPRTRSGSGAVGVRFTFSPEGHNLRHELCDIHGNPQPNSDGSFGEQSTYDDRGFPALVTNLGPDLKPGLHRDGYVSYRESYDSDGNETGMEYLDAEGKPTTAVEGYSRVSYLLDEHGNIIEEAYYDVAGQPAWHTDGYVKVRRQYDDYGNVIREAYFDAQDKPARSTDGYCGLTAQYDDRGNQIARDYFGPDGKPTLHTEGYASLKGNYDELGNQTEMVFYGVDGKPVLHPGGYAKSTATYDEQGFPTEFEYFGLDGKRTFNKEGCARQTQRWLLGNCVETAYFGLDGSPALHPDGNVKWRAKYDPRGNQIELVYLGPDDRPVLTRHGFASSTARYNEHGYKTETAYYDAEGKPTIHADGYHRSTSHYDDRGNETRNEFFDEHQKLVLTTSQYARLESTFDDKSGKITELRYFDANGKPTDEYAINRMKYDDRGNMIETWYLDGNRKRVPTKEGFSRWTAVYDAVGRLVKQEYFDIEDQPVLRSGGYSRRTLKYDDLGRQVEEAYYGPDGERILTPAGYAGWTHKYDSRGNLVKLRYFGADEQPIIGMDGHAGFDHDYDARGNLVETRYVGVDEKPKRIRGNFAIWKARYNDRGWKVVEEYYDESEQPVLHANRFFRVAYEHNQWGYITRRSLFGTDGKPTSHIEGHSALEDEYDAHGNMVAQRFFDTEGKPFLNRNGVAGWTAKYDNRRNRIEERYEGIDGKPVVGILTGTNGYLAKYDARGNHIENTFIDVSGRMAANAQGVARWTAKYDNRKLKIEDAAFDATGQPALASEEGWHRQTLEYDQRDRHTGATFFGPDGNFIITTYGYSRWTSEYDAQGRHIRRRFFDVHDQPIATQPVVGYVISGGQGAGVGLQPGDVLLRYDGVDILDAATFIDTRNREFNVFRPHVLEVRRNGETVRLDDFYPGLLHAEIEDRAVKPDVTPPRQVPDETRNALPLQRRSSEQLPLPAAA